LLCIVAAACLAGLTDPAPFPDSRD
jgi:hypothetical protein